MGKVPHTAFREPLIPRSLDSHQNLLLKGSMGYLCFYSTVQRLKKSYTSLSDTFMKYFEILLTDVKNSLYAEFFAMPKLET